MPTAPRKPDKDAPKGRPSIVHDPIGLERLVFFSDAVFAIAITLLALDIRLPAGAEFATEAALRQGLLAIWHKYLSFVISFLVIGAFWLGHHRKFRLIDRYDRRLLWLNLLLLMSIAFVPFPTSVLSDYGNKTATVFYAASMAASGLLLAAVWLYASHHGRLTVPNLEPRQRQTETWRAFIAPAVFLLSIVIAQFDSTLAQFSWILIAPASLLLR